MKTSVAQTNDFISIRSAISVSGNEYVQGVSGTIRIEKATRRRETISLDKCPTIHATGYARFRREVVRPRFLMSRCGGAPKRRLYSRLNCEGLS